MSLMPPSATHSVVFRLPLEVSSGEVLREAVGEWVARLRPFLGHIKGSARGPKILLYASSTGAGVNVQDLSATAPDEGKTVLIEVTAILLQVPANRLEATAQAVVKELSVRYPLMDLQSYGEQEPEPHHHH